MLKLHLLHKFHLTYFPIFLDAHLLKKIDKGNFSPFFYNFPENHQENCEIREEKVQRVVDMVPDLELCGDEEGGEVLVVSWGGTYGHTASTVRELRLDGKNVSLAHFNYIKPLPKNTEEVFGKFKKIIVCELNLGQFAAYLRDVLPQFTYHQANKVKGLPFTVSELKESITKLLED